MRLRVRSLVVSSPPPKYGGSRPPALKVLMEVGQGQVIFAVLTDPMAP